MTTGILNRIPPNRRIPALALAIFLFDQVTKALVLRYLQFAEEKVVLDGFFKFVHWRNTGAAWSMFEGGNNILAVVSVIAMIVLYLFRHHFDSDTQPGRLALGLIFGGILGNLADRVFRQHVVDFVYFHVISRAGVEHGFPAFNVADAAICTGVGLLFLMAWWGPGSTVTTAGNGR